jgi:hypothetical protein
MFACASDLFVRLFMTLPPVSSHAPYIPLPDFMKFCSTMEPASNYRQENLEYGWLQSRPEQAHCLRTAQALQSL